MTERERYICTLDQNGLVNNTVWDRFAGNWDKIGL